jgi:hypothetical protein
MTTLSSERVDVLTETVSDLSRSAQLSTSLANLANSKSLVEVTNAAEQDAFLQTVLALHNEGKMEKNCVLWLASCLKHDAFIVFTEADFVKPLSKLWRLHTSRMAHPPLLAELLQVEIIDTFTPALLNIAAILYALPTTHKHDLGVLLASLIEKEETFTKGTHLIMPRALVFMAFAQDLWFDYGIELSIAHFYPSWLSLSEGRTAAIERVVFHLLRYNAAINSTFMHQIVHILVLITLSIKEMQTEVFDHQGTKQGLWLTSQELEKLLTQFIFDENFLLLTTKVNVLDFKEMQLKTSRFNTIRYVFLHWLNNRYASMMDRFITKDDDQRNFTFSFEQLVKYLPPFALICCDRFAYQFDWSQNIRLALPQLTQKEAHIFSNHPFVDFQVQNANPEYAYYLWSSKVKNSGGNAHLALAMYQFKQNNFGDLAFWESVIRFCVAHEATIERHLQEHANFFTSLFGYLAHKRHEDGNLFDMKGRTLRALMQQSEEWYAEMQRNRYINFYQSWKGAGYAPYELIQAESVYTITQLTTNVALKAESAALHHCVSGYGYKCVNGSCSIWSLRLSIEGSNTKPLVTIEIDNSRNIIQAKTANNAQPIGPHLEIIKAWAAREGISFVRC